MSNSETITEVEKESIPAGETVEILADGKMFVLKAPVSIGKMGVYGALEMMRDEVSKFYFIMEKRAREEREKSNGLLLSRMKLPTVGKLQ
jgi:hypothetical protein